jgi:hypothetical protein
MRPARALGLTAAFALGTETWMIGSQALWQHGTEELLLIVALLALTGGPLTAARLGLGGAACGLVIAGRPIDGLLVAPFAFAVPFWAGRRSGWFLLGAAVPLVLVAAYNLTTFGLLGGGYALFIERGRRYFEQPLARGLVEMLFSPDKGLFVYTPFLLFLPIYLRRALAGGAASPRTSGMKLDAQVAATGTSGMKIDAQPAATGSTGLAAPAGPPAAESPRPRAGAGALRRALADRDRALTVLLLAGILAQLLIYARSEWRGGSCYGPRYLTDVLPLATWMLGPVVESLAPLPLALFRWAALFSVAVQAIGAFCYPRGASDLRMHEEPSRLPAYLIEASAGVVTPGWLEALRGR